MRKHFQGWVAVAQKLLGRLENQTSDERLNEGQRASIRLAAQCLQENGLVIADEVGMGKTRIAVELARAVVEAGGRVADSDLARSGISVAAGTDGWWAS